jgi:hypothetical protein
MMREDGIAGLKIGRTWLVCREALDNYMKRTANLAKHDPRRIKNKTPLLGRLVLNSTSDIQKTPYTPSLQMH